MHNKLTIQVAQGVNKLRSARPLYTLIGSKINPLPWKRENAVIRVVAVGDPESENLSNLLQHGTRQIATCESSRPNMSEMRETVTAGGAVFRLSDYDCVGFDLDNTICRYKLSAMVKLEYDTLSQYLVNEKGYDPEHLYRPIEKDMDFMQKGLVLDFVRGNVLQIDCNGCVLKASHGTKILSEDEIVQVYGKERQWGVAAEFIQNMLEAWNGPLSEKIRTLLDYFDMPASLAFARIVDSLNAQGKKQSVYNVWPDVLDGLIYMFRRENFQDNIGGYFPAVKSHPEKYINKCSSDVLNWLKEVKKEKFTFLITGSHVDFASLVASTCMGEDWRNFFDIVVCYARKPGFFTGGRPFISIVRMNEDKPLKASELHSGNMYSQGNWQDLYACLARETGKHRPRCVYIGDNLIQDVYTPAEYTVCDVVAVVEELLAEGMAGCDCSHADSPVLTSNTWGSYFCSPTGSSDPVCNANFSLWTNIIQKHSKICVPCLEYLAEHPLDHSYSAFVTSAGNKCKQLGYYPSHPATLQDAH